MAGLSGLYFYTLCAKCTHGWPNFGVLSKFDKFLKFYKISIPWRREIGRCRRVSACHCGIWLLSVDADFTNFGEFCGAKFTKIGDPLPISIIFAREFMIWFHFSSRATFPGWPNRSPAGKDTLCRIFGVVIVFYTIYLSARRCFLTNFSICSKLKKMTSLRGEVFSLLCHFWVKNDKIRFACKVLCNLVVTCRFFELEHSCINFLNMHVHGQNVPTVRTKFIHCYGKHFYGDFTCLARVVLSF